MKLHHVQVSMPSGQEELARRFYRDAVGLVEVQKPPGLAGRGGCWFRGPAENAGGVEIHLGVEEPFVAAKKAHPALILDSVEELEALGERIAAGGFAVSWEERATLDGYVRFHARDGFGNRLEVLTPSSNGA